MTNPNLPAVALEPSLVGESSKHVAAGAQSQTTFIYALCCPMTGELRYIGKADNPAKRLRDHLCECKRETNRKANWIRSLTAKGLTPILEIIDEVEQTEWQSVEAAYIMFFKDEGCNLVNGSPGGDGVGSGEDHPKFGKPGKKHTAEDLVKMRAAQLGRKHSLDTRTKLSASRKGIQISPEHRAKISAAFKGRKLSSQHRTRIGAALKGRKHSPELCAKNSASHKGLKASPETRAKMSAARKGQKRSPEQCARLSDALRGRTFSAEHRANISNALIGRKLSIEHCAKLSAAAKRRAGAGQRLSG